MSSSPKLTLICFHGNSSSKRVFAAQELHFEKVIAEDLPGHGDQLASDDPSKDYSLDSLRELLIKKYKNLDSCVLLGNSLGGHVAIEIAPQLPNLKGLVIFGTPPVRTPLNIGEAFHPVEALSSFFQGLYEVEALKKTLQTITSKKEHFDILFHDFINTDPTFRDVWAVECMEKHALLDEVEIVKNLGRPIYVIHGKQDQPVNLEYIKGLEGITKVFEIDDCGHYPSIEQPEKFNAIVEEILKELGE